ncbi:MAG: cobyric acid synthase [Candidatus Binatia bacterium]
MPAKTLMVQGTASSAGKSILVTALCRILRQEGLKVTPFKAQNMSLNSFVTRDGSEMGRAQVVQAEAAHVEPTVEMNPILLKPEADNRSQVVVGGKSLGSVPAKDYYALRGQVWKVITESLDSLLAHYDVVLIEGAGSPVEVNLKDRDLANMRVALYCRAHVFLVADIDRGGVFASLVGTLELLEPQERALIRAFVINKFRGDPYLLRPGLKWLEERTGIPVAGIIPYYHGIHIAEEDSVSLERRRAMKARTDYVLDIAVVALPHISNFDDFDPLEQEDGIRLRYVEPDDDLGEPDLIILPGTKSTMADLAYLRSIGLAQKILARAQKDTPIIGICGGYQMLGRVVLDPEHVESAEPRAAGLGLLPVTTTFSSVKSTHQVRGRAVCGRGLLQGATGLPIDGYEIHMGQTTGDEMVVPLRIDERSRRPCLDVDGCMSPNGNVLGTYIHGLFHNEGLRRSILGELAARKGLAFRPAGKVLSKEEQFDRLAALVRSSLNIDFIYRAVDLKRH